MMHFQIKSTEATPQELAEWRTVFYAPWISNSCLYVTNLDLRWLSWFLFWQLFPSWLLPHKSHCLNSTKQQCRSRKNCYSAGFPCIPDDGKIRVNSNRIRHYFSKSESGWSDLNSLTLRADRNRDGDLEDTREKIAYRYDQQTLTLFRKSGNSAYQTLIENIPALKFEILEGSSPQTCIKVTVQVIIDAPEQETVLCQLVW